MGRTRKTLEVRLNSPAFETSANADFSITCVWVTAVWVSLNPTTAGDGIGSALGAHPRHRGDVAVGPCR